MSYKDTLRNTFKSISKDQALKQYEKVWVKFRELDMIEFMTEAEEADYNACATYINVVEEKAQLEGWEKELWVLDEL